MITDFIVLAFANLRHRRLRSWLTMLGIFIGITAVVSLIALGQGLQEAVNEQFRSLGTDKITIQAGSGFSGPPGSSLSSARITDKDVEVIRKTSGVEAVGEMLFKQARIRYQEELKYTFVHGIPQDEGKTVVAETHNLHVVAGKDLKKKNAREVLIGKRIAEGDFFRKPVRLHDTIDLEGKEFTVIGILGTLGNPVDDAAVTIPLETLRELFQEPEGRSFLFVQVKENANADTVVANLKKALRESHHVKEGEEDFQVSTSEQLAQTFTNVFQIVQVVLIGIASISLLVGGIGIMNTMYTSILERTKEIGIMKAIGATNRDILLLFLIESGVLGLAGGLVGALLGIGLSKGVQFIAGQYLGTTLLKAAVSPQLIIGVLLFSVIIGTISGILPAIQASRMNPVEALRYE